MPETSVHNHINHNQCDKERKDLFVSFGVKSVQIDFSALELFIVSTEHSKAGDHQKQRDQMAPSINNILKQPSLYLIICICFDMHCDNRYARQSSQTI